MTEKEKMLSGEVYSAVDPELLEELMVTREMLYEYNSLHPSEIVSKLAAFSSCCSCRLHPMSATTAINIKQTFFFITSAKVQPLRAN